MSSDHSTITAGSTSTSRDLHPALRAAAGAASRTYAEVRASHSRAELEAITGFGAGRTDSMFIDTVVEEAIADATEPYKVNMLSEELGFLDRGSAVTLVIDPLDGSANASSGVPLACFSGAVAVDYTFTQASTQWLDTGRS